MTSRIKLRTEQLAKYMPMCGIDSQRALSERIGVAESTVYRVLEGRTAPGEKFIAGILRAFPQLDFDDLFEVVDAAA